MENKRARLAVLISGGGTNLQVLIDAVKTGILSADIVYVVSSRRDAYGLERAAKEGIETFVFKAKKYPSPQEADQDLLARLQERKIDFVALAGYLKLVPLTVIRAFRNRVVNIHPARLPEYGGKGMYGHHVHEAVIAAGDTESGPTVHLVDEVYDHGKVLEYASVPVLPDDTPDTLAARILVQEHRLYPRVLQKLIKGEYSLG